MITAVPEWAVLARRDLQHCDGGAEAVAGCWATVPTMALRGSAHTNFERRSMAIPVGNDARSKAVRGHELLHARLSPFTLHPVVLETWGVSQHAVMVAEELRVNTVLKSSKVFDYRQLKDGSEVNHARSIAGGSDDFLYDAVCHLVATMNTGSESGVYKALTERWPIMSGIRQAIKATIRENKKKIGYTFPQRVSVSDAESYLYPTGFCDFTIPVALIIDTFKKLEGEEGKRYTERINARHTTKPVSGESARLIIGYPQLTENGRNFLSRTRRASASGRLPKRLHRMLTDPERRIFDRIARHAGGTVVIDCSGSMGLSTEQVREIVHAAAGCTVIAYSLMPGIGKANAWILAKDGSYVSYGNMPTMGSANGVDEPVLEWAIRNRKKPSDPIVWVCDGHVTDCNDSSSNKIKEACVTLAVEHGIRQVPTVDGAITLLKEWAVGRKAPPSLFGPVARWAVNHNVISINEGNVHSDENVTYYDRIEKTNKPTKENTSE